ncbi:MAG: VWA domain-containing protein [Thermoanaerobaculia bacterium]
MNNRRSQRRNLPLFAAAALFLVSPALLGQNPQQVFSEVIDVRVVNIEVVVTDRDGLRVTGLGPQDFLLLVDSQEVPIEYFTEVSGGRAVTRQDDSSTVAVPAVADDGTVGTSMLVFVDDSFSVKRDRDRAIDRLVEQLPVLGEADRMAVVAFEGDKLEMLSSWTGSIAELRRVLESAKERRARGLQHEALLRRPRESGDIGRIERSLVAERVADQMRRVILATTAALRSFAKPPGRKAMLLLAGGWPYNPYELVSTSPWAFDSFYTSSQDFGPALYQPLYDTANRLGYTLYTIDLPGLRFSGASAEHRTIGQGRLASELSTNRERTENATLSILADQTGGKAFLNASAKYALEEVARDVKSYYWLGFSPAWRGENRRHRLRVHLRDPSLKVRSRRSFSDLSRKTEVTMMVESALLLGDMQGPSALGAEIGEIEGAGFRRILVPLELLIPLDALTFLPGAKGWTTQVELRVAVEDKNGNRNEIQVIPLHLDYPAKPAAGELGRYTTRLKMRKMKHDLVVSIHDELSGTILWKRLELAP